MMLLDKILTLCDSRNKNHKCGECINCSYSDFCPGTCERCLDFIHNPKHAPQNASSRKYDCRHMADFYTCKYSCRYASEIVYAIERMNDLLSLKKLKVLSFGCGPCTDLFAIDFLHSKGTLQYKDIEYRGIDYSSDVWKNIHSDIKSFENESCKIQFFYQDVCDIINEIANDSWVPNLIVFQYVFSDMKKHTQSENINTFIKTFGEYFNAKLLNQTYVVLNDINLGTYYGGGRDYFDQLLRKLNNVVSSKGRFRDDNTRSSYYPYGYPYGEDSDGEFPQNDNRFDFSNWCDYSPFETCASAQMIIKKEE